MKLVALSFWLCCAACVSNTFDIDLDPESAEVAVDVFSGRPNPTFTMTAAEVAALEKRLSKLTETDEKPPDGVLGYRGFVVRQGEQRLYIGSARVVLESGDRRRVFIDRRGAEAYLKELAGSRGYGNLIRD